MHRDLEARLATYAELIVRVGLNLQPGQRLLIGSPLGHGVVLPAAPLVRLIAEHAYRNGARFVDVMWTDEATQLVRYQHAPRDSFAEYPVWQAEGIREHVQAGGAHLTVRANDPDLLRDQDPQLVATAQRTTWEHLHPFMEQITRNATNWCVVSAAGPGWASRVFPQVAPPEQEDQLWQAILNVSRALPADAIFGWQRHVAALAATAEYLTRKQYAALKFTGPGTDLTVGLPTGHLWGGGRVTSAAGVVFTPNLPTEEVWTLPHKDRVEGVVTATKPLTYGGTVIDGFRLKFAQGRVVESAARRGEVVLRKLLETDEGAVRLGEVALVPHSSPISQSGLLFYNTLIDENAASHVALGQGYKFTLRGGESLSDDAFAAAGGNRSLVHVDFMIGSGDIDVDGMTGEGRSEPVMRRGEWAFAPA